MRSGRICQTEIKTAGRVRKTTSVVIQWKIGNGQFYVDGVLVQYDKGVEWIVGVADGSLDKVIAFLQKVRKEMKGK